MNQKKPSNEEKSGLLKKSRPVFLAFAKIRKPHALKGELSVEMLADFPEHYHKGAVVYVGSTYDPQTIQSIRKTGKTYLIAFEGLSSRDAVETLRNTIIYVKTDSVPDLAENAFYHHDLIGLVVKDGENQSLGFLSEIITTGANDVYVITSGQGDDADILIPAIDSVIRKIDLENGEIIVDLPEWL